MGSRKKPARPSATIPPDVPEDQLLGYAVGTIIRVEGRTILGAIGDVLRGFRDAALMILAALVVVFGRDR